MPSLRVTRFAQLEPGDLFILRRREERYVGLTVHDATEEGQKLLLPIGPTLPNFMTYPTLISDPGATVISFGKDYTARLPIGPGAWEDDEPPAAVTAIAVAEDGVFLRCNFSNHPHHFQACYVDLKDGEICATGRGRGAVYARPNGIRAFATHWDFITIEEPARSILTYPF